MSDRDDTNNMVKESTSQLTQEDIEHMNYVLNNIDRLKARFRRIMIEINDKIDRGDEVFPEDSLIRDTLFAYIYRGLRLRRRVEELGLTDEIKSS